MGWVGEVGAGLVGEVGQEVRQLNRPMQAVLQGCVWLEVLQNFLS